MRFFHKYLSYSPSFQYAQIEERRIPLPSGCTDLRGRTLLFLSDVHASESMFPERAVRRLIDQIASVNPDMLLLGGDYAESAEWEFRFFDMLSAVRPPLGTFAVLGNNDVERFSNALPLLCEHMQKVGVTPLVDRSAFIQTDRSAITVAGLSEFINNPPPTKSLFSMDAVGSFRILLAHYPHSIACHLNCPGIQPHLCLAGHTHGGQFRLGPLTPYSIGFERRLNGVPLQLISGWKTVGKSALLVSPGIGVSRIPFRAGVPPTMHLLHMGM